MKRIFRWINIRFIGQSFKKSGLKWNVSTSNTSVDNFLFQNLNKKIQSITRSIL